MSSTEENDLDVPFAKRRRLETSSAEKHGASHQSLFNNISASSSAHYDHDREEEKHLSDYLADKLQGTVRLQWSDGEGEDVGAAAYMKFKTKKPDARKKAAASTRKAKAKQASKEARKVEGRTGVGIRRPKKSRLQKMPLFGESSSDEELMEWTMPDYVQERRAKFSERVEHLREGGLLLPPSYDIVDFSDDENLEHLKERPDFANSKSLAAYKDIELPYSQGVIPASIAQFLRDYQVKGAAFLHELFIYQRGGILGDDMGLGKTVQVIAFLTAAYGKTGDERDEKRMRKMRRKKQWYPRTLVICPGSLMANWQDEFSRWGWWHVDLYHGVNKDEVLQAASAGMIEVMITTYTTYQKHRGEINMVRWDCVVADECHVVKNRRAEITLAMNEVNALCRIGLTGTAIQNKYEELWTILNWTSPGQLGPISTWRASVSEPLKLGQSHNATVYELARARKTAKKLVQNLLPRFFLRRMKTLIKDQLPKKTDCVVFCPLTSIQADAYQNFLSSEMVQLIKSCGELCDCGSQKKQGWCCHMFLEDGSPWQAWVFPALATLQKLSNHLALLIPSGNDTKEKQAKDLGNLQVAVPDQWKNLYRTRDNILNNSNPEFCGKWRILKKLLKFWHGQGDNKVLIFSHSVRLLKMLHDLFMNSAYNIQYLDGSMKYEERYAAVQDFNSDPTQFVFLISTRAGGIGLNITSANKVVVVDPNWNPSYDLQAQDRAYRIGQTRDVEVFRLVSQGTLEEIVYARQIYKQQQANIGYYATEERRYFQGIQDRKDQKGEIFGLQNLFAYQHENVVLRDIVNKTNVAESRADIRVASLDLGDDDEVANEDNEDDPDRSQKSIKTEDEHEDAAMSQLAAEIKGETTKTTSRSKHKSTNPSTFTASFLSDTDAKDSKATTHRHDPVQAILSNAGVTYTHENSEVIGTSRIEAQLSKRAEKATSDTADVRHSQQMNRVFTDDSQFRPRSSLLPTQDSKYQYQYQHLDPQVHEYTSIAYEYRPPADIRRRQFCTMATWAGYTENLNGIEEFATRVESWTQSQRREFLEAFYHHRRKFLVEHHEDSGSDGDGDERARTSVKQEKSPRDVKEEDVGMTRVMRSEFEAATTTSTSTSAAAVDGPKSTVKIEDVDDDDDEL